MVASTVTSRTRAIRDATEEKVKRDPFEGVAAFGLLCSLGWALSWLLVGTGGAFDIKELIRGVMLLRGAYFKLRTLNKPSEISLALL